MKRRCVNILLILCMAMSWLPIMEASAAEMYSLSGNSMLTYRVVVKTSDIANAGTDAYLYAALSSTTRTPVTDSGYNENYHIYSMEGGDRFEKGYTDTCSLRVKDNLMLSPYIFNWLGFSMVLLPAGTVNGLRCRFLKAVH